MVDTRWTDGRKIAPFCGCVLHLPGSHESRSVEMRESVAIYGSRFKAAMRAKINIADGRMN
jgi:hypothetical protein